MTAEIQTALIVAGSTMFGVVITQLSIWNQSRYKRFEFIHKLEYEASEKRKDRLIEIRRPNLTTLRQTLAELLNIDREGALIQKQLILMANGKLSHVESTDSLTNNQSLVTDEFWENNRQSDAINQQLRKCLDTTGDTELYRLVMEVVKISAELTSLTQNFNQENLNRRKEISELLRLSVQKVNFRIEQLLCGDTDGNIIE